MKNIILAIMFVFSVVWSHDASARASKAKKKPSVTQKKNSVKKKAKVEAAPATGYKSSYLRKKHSRSVASVSSKKKVKKEKQSSASKKSKKKRKH